MKKRVFLAFFLCYSFLSFGALRAEEREANWTNIAVGAASIVPAYFTMTILHEGSHVLAAKFRGADITHFSVWPTVEDGKLFFGRVGTNYPGGYGKTDAFLFYMAPLFADVYLFGLTEALFMSGIVEPASWQGAALFVAGEVAPFINFLLTIGASHDMEMLKKDGVDPTPFRLAGGLLIVSGAAIMVYRARQIFTREKNRPPKEKKYQIYPLADGQTAGAGVAFVF